MMMEHSIIQWPLQSTTMDGKLSFFVINDKREFERIYEYSLDKLKIEKKE